MSKYAGIAAGLLGGFGKGLADTSKRKAEAEIEEAKEARQRAFQLELYEMKRKDNLADQSTADAIEMGKFAVEQDNARRKEVQLLNQQDIENERQAAQDELSAQEHAKKIEKIELEIKALNDAPQAAANKMAKELLTETTSNLNNINERIGDILDAQTGNEISTEQSMELQSLIEQRNSYLQTQEAINSKITDPLVLDYIEGQRQNELAQEAAAVGVDPKVYEKLSNPNRDKLNYEEIAKKFLAGDKEAEIFMAVQQKKNPDIWVKIDTILKGLEKKKIKEEELSVSDNNNINFNRPRTEISTVTNKPVGGLLDTRSTFE